MTCQNGNGRKAFRYGYDFAVFVFLFLISALHTFSPNRDARRTFNFTTQTARSGANTISASFLKMREARRLVSC